MNPNFLLLFNGLICIFAFAFSANTNAFSKRLMVITGKWFAPFRVLLMMAGIVLLGAFGYQLVQAGWL